MYENECLPFYRILYEYECLQYENECLPSTGYKHLREGQKTGKEKQREREEERARPANYTHHTHTHRCARRETALVLMHKYVYTCVCMCVYLLQGTKHLRCARRETAHLHRICIPSAFLSLSSGPATCGLVC